MQKGPHSEEHDPLYASVPDRNPLRDG